MNAYNYELGCVVVTLPETLLLPIQSKIDGDDLHEFGLENQPHVTLFFGLLDKQIPKESVDEIIDDISCFNITLKNISLFKNEKFDVLKFEAESPELNLFNKRLSELPSEQTYPQYNPHCTIAYLKSGRGEHYVKSNPYPPFQVLPTRVKYTRVINNKPEFHYYDFKK